MDDFEEIEAMYDKEDLRVAHHEAAHIVVGWALGQQPIRVHIARPFGTLEPTLRERRSYESVHGLAMTWYYEPYGKTGTAAVIVCLAGYLAEKKLGLKKPWSEFVKQPDYKKAVEITAKYFKSERAAKEFVRKFALHLAGTVVDGYWHLIEALANALIEQRSFEPLELEVFLRTTRSAYLEQLDFDPILNDCGPIVHSEPS